MATASSTENTPLIEFPCDFPIKVMGKTQEDFAQIVVNLIQTISPSFDASRVEMRASSAGHYIGLTCNVHVTSQLELDSVYRTLTQHPLIKYVL